MDKKIEINICTVTDNDNTEKLKINHFIFLSTENAIKNLLERKKIRKINILILVANKPTELKFNIQILLNFC